MSQNARLPLLKTLLSSVTLCLISCVAAVGPLIDVPYIPIAENSSDVLPILVRLGQIRDVRNVPQENSGFQNNSGKVTPEGNVGENVEKALAKAIEVRGGSLDSSADIILTGELRSWSCQTKGSTSGTLNSESSLYLEVRKRSGQKVFSGVFQGVRSSQFPFVSAADIKDSLGFALAQSIDQALNDQSLRRGLSGNSL